MTPKQIRDHVARYSARGILAELGLTVDVVAPVRPGRSVRLRASVMVPDVAEGGRVRSARCTMAPADPTPAELDRAAWLAIIECLRHEAGECFTHEGRLLFDPHEIPRRVAMGLKPFPLDRVRELGLQVFGRAHSANLIAVRGAGKPGDWDGLLYLVSRPSESAGWMQRVWPCATRPGLPYLRKPINPNGTGMLAAGYQNRRSHRIGLHRGRPALVQVGAVEVLRDPDRDETHEPILPERNEGGGFNVHSIGHPNQLAGCLGMATQHTQELLEAYEALVPYQGPLVSLTVLEV